MDQFQPQQDQSDVQSSQAPRFDKRQRLLLIWVIVALACFALSVASVFAIYLLDDVGVVLMYAWFAGVGISALTLFVHLILAIKDRVQKRYDSPLLKQFFFYLLVLGVVGAGTCATNLMIVGLGMY